MADSAGNDTNGCPERYPPISSYAFLSDACTSVLIGPDGAVEWMCVPRFDGPSIFAAILDRDKGGSFKIEVEGAGLPERNYLEGSLVLESKFTAPEGEATLHDFLSLEAEGEQGRGQVDSHHVFTRLIECRSGSVKVKVCVDARPDYGRTVPQWREVGEIFRADAPGTHLWVGSDCDLQLEGSTLVAEFELKKGESGAFSVRYRDTPLNRMVSEIAKRLLKITADSWNAWSGRCLHEHNHRELIMRSAVVLKGLVYNDSGALLAAPTTSLPEDIGGERNWDYRYSWLRDSSLMLMALFRLGYAEEGHDYLRFVFREFQQSGNNLPLMVGVGGENNLEESTLDHLEGYGCSAPVRIGNGAVDQLQLDIYGEVMDAAYFYQLRTGHLSPKQWPFLVSLADFVCDNWNRPDNGIWEVRSELQHFTYSKIMCWACLDRAVKLAKLMADDSAPTRKWKNVRDQIHADVIEKAWDEELGSFVQYYGASIVDASSLRIPLVGFLDGKDPKMLSTVDRIKKDLHGGGGLVFRYRLDQAEDGLSGEEGGFAICSFWLVSALVFAGRLEEAKDIFEEVIERRSELGLFAEELAPDGSMLGNYPQAFTHLALIQAATNISAAEHDQMEKLMAVVKAGAFEMPA